VTYIEKAGMRTLDQIDFKLRGAPYGEDPKYRGKMRKREYELDNKGMLLQHTSSQFFGKKPNETTTSQITAPVGSNMNKTAKEFSTLNFADDKEIMEFNSTERISSKSNFKLPKI
jgi:hypothetical protein